MTQFLIVDNEFAAPPKEVDLGERHMTLNDPKFPPLIPEYRGPQKCHRCRSLF
jgi:hypothetical protein